MPVERAETTDRLKVLYLAADHFKLRLCRDDSFGAVTNLPGGWQLAGCRFDADRGIFAIQIRHQSFPLVARGTVLAEFPAQFNSLVWYRGTPSEM
jgi:hypothetical protein